MGENFLTWQWADLGAYIMPWSVIHVSPFQMFMNWFGFFILQFAILWCIARILLHRHKNSINRREAMSGRPFVTSCPDIPEGYQDPAIIYGSAVISHAKIRGFRVMIHSLIGGKVPSLEQTLDLARREALLRLEEEAQARRSDLIVNLRVTSHGIGLTKNGQMAVEIMASGTALGRIGQHLP